MAEKQLLEMARALSLDARGEVFGEHDDVTPDAAAAIVLMRPHGIGCNTDRLRAATARAADRPTGDQEGMLEGTENYGAAPGRRAG